MLRTAHFALLTAAVAVCSAAQPTRPATAPASATAPAEQPLALPSTLEAPRPPAAAAMALPSFAEPAISPDGSEIAFVCGGDIWTVPAAGGEARLLVSHQSAESRPLYSPDGRRLAFVSQRTGNGDIYVLSFDTGELARITYDDGTEALDAWSADGKWLYYSTANHDVGGMMDVYRVSAAGGTPMPVVADRYAHEFHAAPSPDGTSIAFCAGGASYRNWYRLGHCHGDESEIWLSSTIPANAPARRLTEPGACDLWPTWSPDGRTLYFASDRGGTQNLWCRTPDGTLKPLTHFTDGHLIYPRLSADGRTVAFERDFGIWTVRLTAPDAAAEPARVPIRLRGTAAGATVEHHNFDGGFSEMALSPDGRKVAFVVHGEVFAAGAREGGEAVRVTQTSAIESHVAWAPDSRRIVYVSDRDGPASRHLFLYDFATAREYRLTSGPGQDDSSPRFAPDNVRIAFQRNASDLVLLDPARRRERVLARGQEFDRAPFDRSPSPFVFSPRGDWVAFLATGPKGFDNVYLVPTGDADAPTAATNPADARPRQVTFLANAGSRAVSWSPDGTFLLYATGQRTEEYQLARVDLTLKTPTFREDSFRDLFRDGPRPNNPLRRLPPTDPDPRPALPPATAPATLPAVAATGPAAAAPASGPAAAAEPTRIVFDNIRQRLSLLAVNGDVAWQTISPDGKTLLFAATLAGQQNLYTLSIDDRARDAAPRQLTAGPGYKASAQFSPDGKEVFYLDAGKLAAIPLDVRVPRAIGLVAEMDVDFAREKLQVFRQAWGYLHDNFFDRAFNGADWTAVRARYEPRVAGCHTPEELRRLLMLMVGELNASHTGVSGPATGRSSVGRLGLSYDFADYERTGLLRVASVLPLSPAAIAGIKPGDYLCGIDRARLTPRTSLDQLLDQKVNKRVVVVIGDRFGQHLREVPLQATDAATERALRYRDWVEGRRAYVAAASAGRLGYVHVADMSESALARLYADLDSENQTRDGVVVDVRNNRGGFVNGSAIDILTRRNYLTMTRRGSPPVPSRIALGQRALGVPTVLLTNRLTISDGEDFTEGYRFFKLGKVVGEPTAGAVIFTSNVPLLDGTVLRLPETLVTDQSGTPLEMHPRPVDVPVARPAGESYTDHDAQLDAAVRELLAQLEPAGNPTPSE